jgi:tetratricopeptide (TPR) repeat protein
MNLKTQRLLTRAKKIAKSGNNEEAKKLFSLILKDFPQNLEAKNGLLGLDSEASLSKIDVQSVIRLITKSKTKEALVEVNKLIKDFPDEPSLFNLRGACHQSLGELKKALKDFQESVTLNPQYAAAHYNLGVIFHQLGENNSAIKNYKRAIEIKHNYPDAHNNLGNIYLNLRMLDAALDHFEWAVALNPEYAEAHNNLGIVFMELGQYEKCIKSCERAVSLKADYALPHNNLGIAFQSLGLIDSAVKSYENAINIRERYAAAHHNLSALKKFKKNDLQISQMLSLHSSKSLSQTERIHICFALAKVNDDLGQQKKLFEFLDEGNRLRKKNLNYVISSDKEIHLLQKQMFESNQEPIDELLYSKSELRPIFIVGMPRSGSTLVEQIISSHHKVFGAGELYDLSNAVMPIINNYTKGPTKKLKEEDFLSVRQKYFNSISRFNIKENVVTDKMPLNYQNIGFILSSFPEAKIIHVKRDARAICWSIYKHYFNAAKNGWAYNQKDLASFYALYSDIMEFWKEKFKNSIYDLCYEDLTTNQEDQTRKLLNYCDLEWDKNCLNFHSSKRAVKTASSLQVRKKMYQGSSEVWKKHQEYIKPLIKALSL